jgi:Putative oxalocrotonate tautomerase enzyme
MPNYVVTHQFDISESERTAIAQAITHAHGDMFSVPYIFVNVTFQPTSQCVSYAGGKRVTKATNSVTGYVRNVSRPQEEYAELCHRIKEGWKNAIGPNSSQEKQLTSIFVQGIIAAGWEQGVMIPESGHDRDWLKEQFTNFKKKADSGEEEMKELVEDIETRKLI